MKHIIKFCILLAVFSIATVTCKKDKPTPVISITTQPASISVTEGSTSGVLTVVASVTEGATLTYQWFSNPTAINTGGTAAIGETAATLTIPETLPAGTYYFFCEVSASGGAKSVRSSVATVTITVYIEPPTPTPVITITTQPEAETTVTSGSISLVLNIDASVTDDATLSYQWYSNNTNSNVGGTVITDGTGSSLPIPELPIGTYYFFCEVSATGGAEPKRSNVAAVTVEEPTPIAKAEGSAVSTPTVSGTPTATSITVNAATLATATGQSVEYTITTTTTPPALSVSWQSGTTFSGLPTNTAHYVWARSAENDDYNAGTPQRSEAITTLSVTLTVGAQVGTLKADEAGSVTFPLTATNYPDGTEISGFMWFSNAGGTTPSSIPAGLTASATNVSDGEATVTISGTAIVAGDFYFRVVIGGIASTTATLTVINPEHTPGSVEVKYRFSGGRWEDTDFEEISGAVSNLTENTFTVTGGGVNISYTGVYTEGGGVIGVTTWSYLYNSSGKIGIVGTYEQGGFNIRYVYLGKSFVEQEMAEINTDGMQDTHNGYAEWKIPM